MEDIARRWAIPVGLLPGTLLEVPRAQRTISWAMKESAANGHGFGIYPMIHAVGLYSLPSRDDLEVEMSKLLRGYSEARQLDSLEEVTECLLHPEKDMDVDLWLPNPKLRKLTWPDVNKARHNQDRGKTKATGVSSKTKLKIDLQKSASTK